MDHHPTMPPPLHTNPKVGREGIRRSSTASAPEGWHPPFHHIKWVVLSSLMSKQSWITQTTSVFKNVIHDMCGCLRLGLL
jgi:hypothetical protein